MFLAIFTISPIPVDINECESIPGICDHGSCTNIENGYYCTCDDGYILSEDKKSCIRKSRFHTLYIFLKFHQLRAMSIHASSTSALVKKILPLF